MPRGLLCVLRRVPGAFSSPASPLLSAAFQKIVLFFCKNGI